MKADRTFDTGNTVLQTTIVKYSNASLWLIATDNTQYRKDLWKKNNTKNEKNSNYKTIFNK
jgi:hypothetical protein